MIFSLPSYRRLSDMDLARLRRDDDCNPLNRVLRTFFNLWLLAALWGAPLYARWVLVPDVVGAKDLPTELLGEWWKEDKVVLEFTADQQVRLFLEGALLETADYRAFSDMLEVSDFTRHPGDRDLSINPQHYRISLRGKQLSITPSMNGFTPVAENAAEEWSALRRVLPPLRDASIEFWRRKKR